MDHYALLKVGHEGNLYHVIWEMFDREETCTHSIWFTVTQKPLSWYECHAWIELALTT